MAVRGQFGAVSQVDRGAFAQRVLEVMEQHGDITSEACWQEMARAIAQYWLVFQSDQSPLSTWNMICKCTETVLKIRAFRKGMQEGSGQDALEQFRSFMGEVLEGGEAKETSG